MKTRTDLAWDELCEAADASRSSPTPALVKPSEHPFAKLGPAPYRFAGLTHGKSHCALCGKGIKNIYSVSDGAAAIHALGSECILALGNGFSAHLVAEVKVAKKRYEKSQRAAREKILTEESRAEARRLFPAEVAFLENYSGNFEFYLSLKGQFQRGGSLSDKQWECLTRAVAKQAEWDAKKSQPRTFTLAPGTILIVSKFLGHCIEREFGLNRPHFAIEVVDVEAETEKAYKVRGKLTAHRTSHCCVCGLALKNPVSVANGIGPICGERWGVTTTEELQAKMATEYQTQVSLWVPKSQIKERKEK